MGNKKVELFGDRLQRLRQRAGLSQTQLAEKADIPIGTIRTWEQRKRVPLITVAAKLIEALGCSPGELLGIEAAD